MNTKPTPKRYSPPAFAPDETGTWYRLGLFENRFACELAAVVSTFVFLEERMARVLGVLLGHSNEDTAGYILRAIKSPKGRIDLMRDLLELAPHNASLGPEYDEIIREFKRLNSLRNNWVHGQWWTRADKTVWIAEWDEHGFGILTKRQVDIAELRATNEAINHLHDRIDGMNERRSPR